MASRTHGSSRRRPRRLGSWALIGAVVSGLAALGGAAPLVTDAQANDGQGAVAFTTGGGRYMIGSSLEIDFSFAAVALNPSDAGQLVTGPAGGHFRQSVVLGGQLIEFHGEVTCLTVDPANHRAWIGGIVTKNNSEHPDFLLDINQPGRDVWFRVLDDGEGPGALPDRSTFLGFEGAAGIITSPEYCEAAIWPDNNARTNPVFRGNILVRP